MIGPYLLPSCLTDHTYLPARNIEGIFRRCVIGHSSMSLISTLWYTIPFLQMRFVITKSPHFDANACFYISWLHFSNFANIRFMSQRFQIVSLYPCTFAYFGLWGVNSCIMHVLKIFRCNSIYLDFYIAYYVIFLALMHVLY